MSKKLSELPEKLTTLDPNDLMLITSYDGASKMVRVSSISPTFMGAQGPQGIQGDVGAQGPQGIQGPAGSSDFMPPIAAYETKRSLVPINGITAPFSQGFGTSGTGYSSTTGSSVSLNNGVGRNRQIRLKASSGAQAAAYFALATAHYFVGNGWRFKFSFGYGDTVMNPNTHQFHGMGATGLLSGILISPSISTLTNIIGIGSDSSSTTVFDSNLSIFHNDASGAATKIDLGSDFPANRTAGASSDDWFVFELYNARNSSDILYRVTNVLNGAVATGTISSNIPDSLTGLGPTFNRINNAASGNSIIEFGEIAVYSPN